jgi:uncharacterized protein (TIGR03067 family)
LRSPCGDANLWHEQFRRVGSVVRVDAALARPASAWRELQNTVVKEQNMRYLKLLIVLTPIALAGAGSPDDAAKQDLQRYQGTWAAVSIVNPDGRKATEAELRDTRLVVAGNTFTLTSKDLTVSGTFTLDPSRSPKTIDVFVGDTKKTENKLVGIYQIDGEIRRSSFALSGQARPRDFSALQKGCLQFEWKRQAP